MQKSQCFMQQHRSYRTCYIAKRWEILFITLCFSSDSLVIHVKEDMNAFCRQKSTMFTRRNGSHHKCRLFCFLHRFVVIDRLCVCCICGHTCSNQMTTHTFRDMNAFMWCKSGIKVIFECFFSLCFSKISYFHENSHDL